MRSRCKFQLALLRPSMCQEPTPRRKTHDQHETSEDEQEPLPARTSRSGMQCRLPPAGTTQASTQRGGAPHGNQPLASHVPAAHGRRCTARRALPALPDASHDAAAMSRGVAPRLPPPAASVLLARGGEIRATPASREKRSKPPRLRSTREVDLDHFVILGAAAEVNHDQVRPSRVVHHTGRYLRGPQRLTTSWTGRPTSYTSEACQPQSRLRSVYDHRGSVARHSIRRRCLGNWSHASLKNGMKKRNAVHTPIQG